MTPLRLVPFLFTLLLAAGLAPTAIAASGPGAMGDGGMMGDMMGNMGMMGGIMMLVPALICLLLIVLLVMAILALAKYLRQG